MSDFNLSLDPSLLSLGYNSNGVNANNIMGGGMNNLGGDLGTPQLSGGINMANTPGTTPGFLGMSPANIAAIGGMLGKAIGGNTTGGRIAGVAEALGQTHINALAAQKQQKQQMAFLKDLLGKGGDLSKITPEQASALGIATNLSLNPNSSDSGNIKQARLGNLGTPTLSSAVSG